MEHRVRRPLQLQEALFMLALEDESGVCLVPGIDAALAAGVLGELVLSGRIDFDGDSGLLRVVNPMPTGDPLLDAWLRRMAGAPEGKTTLAWWTSAMVGSRIYRTLANLLVRKRLVRKHRKWVLGILPHTFYPSLAIDMVQDLLQHIQLGIIGEEGPPHDAFMKLLISIGHSTGVLRAALGPEFVEQHNDRILDILNEEVLGGQVAEDLFDQRERERGDRMMKAYAYMGGIA